MLVFCWVMLASALLNPLLHLLFEGMAAGAAARHLKLPRSTAWNSVRGAIKEAPILFVVGLFVFPVMVMLCLLAICVVRWARTGKWLP